MSNEQKYRGITVRPYHLMCMICSIGEREANPTNYKKDENLETTLAAIRRDPDIPVTLCCNAWGTFSYQDPGIKEDSSEGAEYNRKRDLEILRKLDYPPGITLPARVLLLRLLDAISTTNEICGYDIVSSTTWKGCRKAKKGYFEQGHKKAAEVIITERNEEEMDADRSKAVEEIYTAKVLSVRPHILLCAVCDYDDIRKGPGNAARRHSTLVEFMDVIRRSPDTQVALAKGSDRMVCGPCPLRVNNGCVIGPIGNGGLYNEMKDLNVLQRTGLAYGSTMKARGLFNLLFDKIPTVFDVCAIRGNPSHSVWWDPCGAEGKDLHRRHNQNRELMKKDLLLN